MTGAPPWAVHREPGNRAWLFVFADLVLLLLAFFVMLFAMSGVRIAEWQSTVRSLAQTFDPAAADPRNPAAALLNTDNRETTPAIDLGYLSTVLKETMQGDPFLARAEINREEDQLVLAWPADLLFAPNSSALPPRIRAAMVSLGALLGNIGNAVAVYGHADPDGDEKRMPGSAWELSLARAAALANALRINGYARDIVAYGVAGRRQRVAGAAPAGGRDRPLDRVDIVILSGREGPS